MMTGTARAETASPLVLAGVGVGAGILSGMFGVGGGTLMVPALVLLVAFAQHRAHATSLAAVVPIAAVGAVVFGRADSVNLGAAIVLGAGSLMGVQAGARTMNRLSDDRLALVFGIFLVVLAISMFVL
jgi:uncharacterized protein